MSYEDVETQLSTQLVACSSLSSTTVSKGDRTILNKGPSKAAVIVYESFDQVRETFGATHAVDWRSRVFLFVKYQTDSQMYNDMRDLRNEVINRINQYPHLGDSTKVWDALIEEGSAEDFDVPIGAIRYQVDSVLVRMTEDLSVTYAE